MEKALFFFFSFFFFFCPVSTPAEAKPDWKREKENRPTKAKAGEKEAQILSVLDDGKGNKP
jgi:hypothetical protein